MRAFRLDNEGGGRAPDPNGVAVVVPPEPTRVVSYALFLPVSPRHSYPRVPDSFFVVTVVGILCGRLVKVLWT